MEILGISNLHKYFGETGVLRGISLSVNQGEVVAIIGPSGSGKSTLLRCASFLEKINSGEIRYEGIPAVTTDAEGKVSCISGKAYREARETFSFVFQNFNLFPHLSVLRNVTDAPIVNQKRDPAEVKAEAMELLKQMGLEGKENSYPCFLSGGQQQRVSIARALAMRPKLLFFDEPTSALDPELTAEVLRIIQNLAKSKMTMVIVTHEIEFAKNVADRVIFMANGSIIEEGTPSEVIDHPKEERTRAFLQKLNH